MIVIISFYTNYIKDKLCALEKVPPNPIHILSLCAHCCQYTERRRPHAACEAKTVAAILPNLQIVCNGSNLSYLLKMYGRASMMKCPAVF